MQARGSGRDRTVGSTQQDSDHRLRRLPCGSIDVTGSGIDVLDDRRGIDDHHTVDVVAGER